MLHNFEYFMVVNFDFLLKYDFQKHFDLHYLKIDRYKCMFLDTVPSVRTVY